MRYTFPHYFDYFHCTAAECEDTCCAGWAIMIDDNSLQKYKAMEGTFGKRVKDSINWEEGSFHQCNGRCAFLNDDNLCDMHMYGGEEMLCDTCRNYPRHMEEYEGLREGSLSLSCIEAAKIILGCHEPVKFITLEDDIEDEEYEDFDFLLFTKLMDAREYMLNILQDRTVDVRIRMAKVLDLAQKIQEKIETESIGDIDDLLVKTEDDESKNKQTLGENDYYTIMRKWIRTLKQLEVLKSDWPEYLKKAEWNLYGVGWATYEEKRKQFHKEIELDNQDSWSACMEQLIVYFIYVYFCGAVYDGEVLSKVQLAIVSTMIIRELIFAVWLQEGEISFEDIVDVAHKYSREVEHSDVNLGRMEKILSENEQFSCKKIMDVLLYKC